jgi:hypothetical protein
MKTLEKSGLLMFILGVVLLGADIVGRVSFSIYVFADIVIVLIGILLFYFGGKNE